MALALPIEPDGLPFLAGISIRFKEPPQVDFGVFTQRFGPEVELPRLKPRQGGKNASYFATERIPLTAGRW